MKPSKRTEAGRIAKTLTKAQRAALIAASFYPFYGEIWTAGRAGVPELDKLGLAYNAFSGRNPLTSVGVAVRAHLLSQDQTDER